MDGEELLKVAAAKHSKHNADEITHGSPLAYKLLYPDGIVENKLRESGQAFSLQEYKAELGKPNNRVTFFYHINCGVIQGFPALRKAVTTHVKKYRIFPLVLI